MSNYIVHVTAASTKNIKLVNTLNGMILDGHTLAVDELILIKDQDVGQQNGIYVISAGKTQRHPNYAIGKNMSSLQIFVQQGNLYSNTGWICTNNLENDVIGTHALTFAQSYGPGVDGNVNCTTQPKTNALTVWSGNGKEIKASNLIVNDDNISGIKGLTLKAPTDKTITINPNNQNMNTILNLPMQLSNSTLLADNTDQTIMGKTLTSHTNTISANLLRTNNGDVNITSSSTPTQGYVLMATSATTADWKSINSNEIGFIKSFSDEKASGSNGGFGSSLEWSIRDINTIKGNLSNCTIQNNIMTIPAGTYHITASAPAYRVKSHQIRLYNVSDNNVHVNGTSEYSNAYAQTRSLIDTYLSISNSKQFRIEHFIEESNENIDFGSALGYTTEVYTLVTIVKIS